MTSNIRFSKEELRDTHGRYVAALEGYDEPVIIEFTRRHEGLISADHVETPTSLRGKGLALKLVEHMVADARAHHFRIIPKCTYVMKQYDRHPEWADVFTAKPHASDSN
ncbi:MAG: N-acetyltransferase [Alphaproteobacteria bacterium]|nr:MAG: N-acetyltransferase [Alphaproteobacteria bacterium]